MKSFFLILGPLLAVLSGAALYLSGIGPSPVAWTVGVLVWTAIWWITEPVPIPVASLVPLAVFPMVGVLTPAEVAESYGSQLVLLMMGGFMLSAAVERSGAHRRIALYMVSLFGGSGGRRLVFGFMSASALLSMWFSNAATTLMLLPIVLAVLEQSSDRRLSVSLLLGVAYAASIGGIATPIGTPPNLIFMKVLSETVGVEIGFVQWMQLALPIALVMLLLAGLWITRNLAKSEEIRMPGVGVWRSEEKRTLAVFGVTAALWITRSQPFGGWSRWSGLVNANDASVALLGVVALFIVPAGSGVASRQKGHAVEIDDQKFSRATLLDWETAVKIPWGILILIGGGIAIAKAFVESGLSQQLGSVLAGVGGLPLLLLIASICLAVTFLTEMTSNTATTTLLLPILAAAAVAADMDPRAFMIPATISASFAFMLPVATPPNAIVFGCEKISMREMAREGLVLNLIGVVVVTFLSYWFL